MSWFVSRKPDGAIAAKYRYHMAGVNDEVVPDDHPDIAAFDAASVPAADPVRQLADALVAKGVLTAKEVPAVLNVQTEEIALSS